MADNLLDFLVGVAVMIAATVLAFLSIGLLVAIGWVIKLVMPLDTAFAIVFFSGLLWFYKDTIMDVGSRWRSNR